MHDDMNEDEVEKKIGKKFGHLNKKTTAGIVKILIDKEKEKYLSIGRSENDEFISKAYQLLDDFKKDKFRKEELFPYFNNAIKRIYYKYYFYFSGKTKNTSSDPKINYIREQYSNPTSRYQSLSWILSSYMDGLDIYARYPVGELKYNNIKFLNQSENKQACNYLLEMVYDFIEVVPLVWQKIDQL